MRFFFPLGYPAAKRRFATRNTKTAIAKWILHVETMVEEKPRVQPNPKSRDLDMVYYFHFIPSSETKSMKRKKNTQKHQQFVTTY